MPPSTKNTYTIKCNNVVSYKGAETKLKITKPTHTTLGGVGAKMLIIKLVDNCNKSIHELSHDEDVNRFVESYIRGQAKSSAKHILGDFYKNIYSVPQPEEQPPQSHADEPTIPIETIPFE